MLRHVLQLTLLMALGPGLAAAEAPAPAPLDVAVEGVEGELARAVREKLALKSLARRGASAAQVRRLQRIAPDAIREALEPFGYYQATAAVEATETAAGWQVRFAVDPGPPTRIATLDIAFDDASVRELRPVRRALRRFKPQPEAVLDHSLYETSKRQLQLALFASGYLDAEATTHRVEVRRGAQRADIALVWTLGPRYRYGETRFEGSQLEAGFLDRYVPWEPGDWYDPTEVLQLQQRLIDADYFAVVDVQPATERAADGVVPIDVVVTPAKRTVYTGGVFVGTDTGPGVRGGVERRWLNRRGHKATLNAQVSQRLNVAELLYRIPLPGPDERSYNAGLAYRDEDTDTSTSQTLRLTANETRLWRGWTRTLGVQFTSGNFEVAGVGGESTLLYPEVTLSRKHTDDVDFPRRGWSLAFGARGTSDVLVSDTSFVQALADAKWIRGIGRRNRFIARGSLGATWVDDFDKLTPELRYFAGGDRTIRGYAFETIGPRNADGLVIGGKHLAVASAEFEHYFDRRWGAAVFVDAGDAFTDRIDMKLGAGVGLRWRSPVGLLRVDLGVPIGDPQESGLQLHLVLGPDL